MIRSEYKELFEGHIRIYSYDRQIFMMASKISFVGVCILYNPSSYVWAGSLNTMNHILIIMLHYMEKVKEFFAGIIKAPYQLS